jgi:hypothetical protein
MQACRSPARATTEPRRSVIIIPSILFLLVVYIYVPQNTLFQHAKVIGCENGCRGRDEMCSRPSLPQHACIGISSFGAILSRHERQRGRMNICCLLNRRAFAVVRVSISKHFEVIFINRTFIKTLETRSSPCVPLPLSSLSSSPSSLPLPSSPALSSKSVFPPPPLPLNLQTLTYTQTPKARQNSSSATATTSSVSSTSSYNAATDTQSGVPAGVGTGSSGSGEGSSGQNSNTSTSGGVARFGESSQVW